MLGYPPVFRNLIFPLMESFQGTEIRKHLAWLKKTQWLGRNEIEEIQNKKLRALIHHAYKNVPYYHQVFKRLGLTPNDVRKKEDLTKLPVLEKEDVRKNLNYLLAQNIPKSKILKTQSSGSTGEPLKYYLDKKSYSIGWAHTFRCWSWARYNLGDPYVKISMSARNSFKKKVQDVLMNCHYIHFLDVSPETLPNLLKTMKKGKIIRGYASSMYIIAKLIEDGNIREIPEPVAIMTTGDTLFPHYREVIESVFECEVFDGYGGESTPIAFECEEHFNYHLCDESVVVEFLKEGEEVAPGELGSIVFTNLDNFAMPFIRYKINDVGVKGAGDCPCGRGLSLMKSVEGRNTDIIVTPSGRFIVPQFFTILFKYIEGVEQFQIIQERIDKVEVRIVINEKFKEMDEDYIFSRIKGQLGEDVELTIKIVSSIPPTESGKRRFVISNVTPF